eukprot:6195279-Pleurochrysis_carterae.AAC.3
MPGTAARYCGQQGLAGAPTALEYETLPRHSHFNRNRPAEGLSATETRARPCLDFPDLLFRH